MPSLQFPSSPSSIQYSFFMKEKKIRITHSPQVLPCFPPLTNPNTGYNRLHFPFGLNQCIEKGKDEKGKIKCTGILKSAVLFAFGLLVCACVRAPSAGKRTHTHFLLCNVCNCANANIESLLSRVGLEDTDWWKGPSLRGGEWEKWRKIRRKCKLPLIGRNLLQFSPGGIYVSHRMLWGKMWRGKSRRRKKKTLDTTHGMPMQNAVENWPGPTLIALRYFWNVNLHQIPPGISIDVSG